MIDTADDKRNLRKLLKSRIGELRADEKTEKSELIAKQIEADPDFLRCKRLMAFWPLQDEPQLSAHIKKWAEIKQVYLPVTENAIITPRLFDGQLAKGAYGALEPSGEPCNIADIDLVIVPGLGFDLQGRRLGRGKGCYDRFLKLNCAVSIGVCFKEQLCESIPAEEHDVCVSKVIFG